MRFPAFIKKLFRSENRASGIKIGNKDKSAMPTSEEIHASVIAFEQQNERWLSLSNEEFRQLPENELLEAAIIRAQTRVDYCIENETDEKPTEKQFILYVVNCFDGEVNNGGLCQFFTNSSRYVAPYLSDSLLAVGAHKHKRLYDGFINENGIDVNELSAFDAETAEEFSENYDTFDFDGFDDAFYDLETDLQGCLNEFVKNNLSEF